MKKLNPRSRPQPDGATNDTTTDGREFVVMEYESDGPFVNNPRQKLVKRHILKEASLRRFLNEIGAPLEHEQTSLVSPLGNSKKGDKQ